MRGKLFIDLSTLAPRGENPLLRKQYPKVNFFTGSTSCSLIYLAELYERGEKRLLLPTRELMLKGFAIYAGELGNVFSKNSINRNAISGCDFARAVNALNWSKKMVEAPWTKVGAQNKLAKLEANLSHLNETNQAESSISEKQYEQFIESIQQLELQIQNLKNQIADFDSLSEDKQQLIVQPFPIVFAFKVEKVNLDCKSSAISGEVVAEGGCTYRQLEAVFVPADKIVLVQALLPEGSEKVQDIAFLEETLNPRLSQNNSAGLGI
ncbi:hypothetical protein ACNVED_12920 [Legionella sp. D16C41]|uniref:hypothetical protein n=1 Tax=Legionella sp. D16C41 TaxID=3402688 RepID=UPI003AF58D60